MNRVLPVMAIAAVAVLLSATHVIAMAGASSFSDAEFELRELDPILPTEPGPSPLTTTCHLGNCGVAPERPSAPHLSASIQSGAVLLVWNVPDDGNSAIIDYTIKARFAVGDPFTVLGVILGNDRNAVISCSGGLTCQVDETTGGSGDTIRASITGLEREKMHAIYVSVQNGVGLRASNVILVTIPEHDPPGAPSNFRADAGDTFTDLSWTAPSNDGGTPITKYVIAARIGNVNPLTDIGTVGGSSTGIRVTHLTNGVQYQFAVYAVNEAGSGPLSKISSVVPSAP